MWNRYQKKNKYGRKKVKKLGYTFDSKLESAVHDILLLREKAGEIRNIKQQVNVHLTAAKILYKPDFSYELVETGETEYAEAKGLTLPLFQVKKRLWAFYGPGKLYIYKGSHTKPYLDEIVISKLDKS
jgi:hypothetical protein